MSYFYEIALTLVSGIGPITAKNLVRTVGSAEGVFAEKASRLKKINEIGESVTRAINNFHDFERVENELNFIELNQIQVHYFKDSSFPKRLLHCADHPLILYSKGKVNLDVPYTISIVGTRNATPYGRQIIRDFTEAVKPYNPLIVSGLAYGVDVSAHKYAIDQGLQTIGVVAHGLDRIYPRIHASVAQSMLNNGGIVTEFLSETNPDQQNFPRRNRIVAGLTDVTLVIESRTKGGSLITARLASDYNRDVFAVPGRIGDPFSDGCNLLIANNTAGIYPGAERLIKLLGWKTKETESTEQQLGLSFDLAEDERILVDILHENPRIRKDELSNLARIPVSMLSGTLLNLELKGVLRNLPGGVFEVTS